MYVVLEYFTYLVVLVVLGALIFVTSAAVLITEESAKFVVASTRRLAVHAGNLAAKHFAHIPHHASHPPESRG